MNRFEIILTLGVIGVVTYFILKNKKKDPIKAPVEEKVPIIKNDIEYMNTSVIKNIFLHYGLDYMNDNAFFNLTDSIMKEVTSTTVNRINNYMKSIQNWDKDKLLKLIELYDSISEEKTKLNIKKTSVESDSPRIYFTSIGDYVKDFNLRGNIETVVLDFLDNFHDMAKDQVLRSIKVNITWIRDNIDYAIENKAELDDVLKRIKDRLSYL